MKLYEFCRYNFLFNRTDNLSDEEIDFLENNIELVKKIYHEHNDAPYPNT